MLGALRVRGHAGPGQSKQVPSGEGRECGALRVRASGGWSWVGEGRGMGGSGSDEVRAGWAVRGHVGPDWAEPVVTCAGSESGSGAWHVP